MNTDYRINHFLYCPLIWYDMSVKELRNKFQGERIFIIGNGPSLKKTPLELLENEYSFAMNRISHIYDETDWRPSFYFFFHNDTDSIDFIEKNIELDIPCFLLSKYRQKFGERKNVYYLNKRNLKKEPLNQKRLHQTSLQELKTKSTESMYDYWSDDPSEIIYTYHSMLGVFQLISYMGFDEVYLIGCDLNYEINNPHLIFENGLDPITYTSKAKFLNDSFDTNTSLKSLINGVVFKSMNVPIVCGGVKRLLARFGMLDDPNHFNSDYDPNPGDKTHADIEITKSHVVINKITSNKGIEVYNATLGGNLEVYKRISFNSLFNQ